MASYHNTVQTLIPVNTIFGIPSIPVIQSNSTTHAPSNDSTPIKVPTNTATNAHNSVNSTNHKVSTTSSTALQFVKQSCIPANKANIQILTPTYLTLAEEVIQTFLNIKINDLNSSQSSDVKDISLIIKNKFTVISNIFKYINGDPSSTDQDDIVEIKDDIVEIKDDIVEIKDDIVEIKDDIVEIKDDTVEIKDDTVEIKDDFVEIKADIVEIKDDFVEIKADIVEIVRFLVDLNTEQLCDLQKSWGIGDPLNSSQKLTDKKIININDKKLIKLFDIISCHIKKDEMIQSDYFSELVKTVLQFNEIEEMDKRFSFYYKLYSGLGMFEVEHLNPLLLNIDSASLNAYIENIDDLDSMKIDRIKKDLKKMEFDSK